MIQETRKQRIKSDYGASSFFLFYNKKSKNPVPQSVYSKIIKEYNSFVRDQISCKGNSYNMPSNMGGIEIRKQKVEISFNDDGSIKNTLPVNWQETRKLWNDNPKAKEDKVKIRFVNDHSGGFTFKLWYIKGRANYKNKSIYRIRFNRQMKRQLSKSIFAHKIDAFVN